MEYRRHSLDFDSSSLSLSLRLSRLVSMAYASKRVYANLPYRSSGGGRGRFTYFGVRLTDNNVSSSFRRMAPLPRPRHRGADFSLLCALKNQPATLTHAYRARRTMRRTESPRCTCTRTSYGIPLCDLTRTSARTRGHECNFS